MIFLIVPNFALPYDQRMVNGLASGFRELGHDAVALGSPVPADTLVKLAGAIRADVVLQVNRFRPHDPPLSPNVRHIAWFQDVFPDTSDGMRAAEREGDIVYALGDPQVLGLKADIPCFVGSLVTGVDPAVMVVKSNSSVPMTDFSLCGYIPPPLVLYPNIKSDLVWYLNDLFDRMAIVGESRSFRHFRFRLLRRYLSRDYLPYALSISLREITTALYRPLRGELDIDALSDALRIAARPYIKFRAQKPARHEHWSQRGRLGRLLAPYRVSGADRRTAVESHINMLAREYPRLLDRVALIEAVFEVSRSLALYGPGWDKHNQFRVYHRGIVNDPYALLAIFQRSRINLANNTHGLGLHSRTLECMAVGGFIFMHRSPHDKKPGGMLTSFEPDVHYGVYTPETFREQAMRWLRDEPGRTKAGGQAAVVIREKHLWRHRAQQILDDLRR
jgi:hypothetical protein